MSSRETGKRDESKITVLPVASRQSQAGSLSALYLRYRPDVIEFVRRKFGAGPPEPEDVAQAVFLQLASQSDPELIRNPRSFLLKSAQNLVLDHRRSLARRRSHVDEFPGEFVTPMSDFDTERVFTAKERLKLLVEVLNRLPRNKRQIVLLSRIYGWSCERIGMRFGMSAEAVQKQIERVLRECLSKLDSEAAPRHRPFPNRLRDRR